MNWLKDKWAALKAYLKGWRTIALNVLAALPLVADQLGAIDITKVGLGDKAQTIYGIGVVLLNLYLRTITTTPVGQKEA